MQPTRGNNIKYAKLDIGRRNSWKIFENISCILEHMQKKKKQCDKTTGLVQDEREP